METWYVVASRSAKAQNRWVKSVESMLETDNPEPEYQYAAFTSVCPAENCSWRRKMRVEKIWGRDLEAIEGMELVVLVLLDNIAR